MQRGLRNAKTPQQVRAERKGSGKDLAVATARIIGIGLVAGTALVVGTNRVMKKLFGKDEPKLAERCGANGNRSAGRSGRRTGRRRRNLINHVICI